MRNRKNCRNAILLLGVTTVVAGLAVIPMFSHDPAVQATADDKYSVASPSAGKDLVSEVVKYKRQGPVKAQIDSDANTVFHPETATLSTTISVGDDGNLGSIAQDVRDANGQLWFSSKTNSSGTTTRTNHQNDTSETKNSPPELLVLDDPTDNPSLVDLYEYLGWTAAESTSFNGRTVAIYRVATPLSEPSQTRGSGIRLPYTDDLDLASFEAEALIDTELNMLLKLTRWAVLNDDSKVVIETMSVMKSKVASG